METVLGIVILVLNLVGVIGLGIAIEHWFKTLLGYIIALIIIAKINIDVILIVLVVVAGITLIFLIFGIINAIKDSKAAKKNQQELEQERKKNEELFWAVKNKDDQTAKNLIENGANVDYIGEIHLSYSLIPHTKSILQLCIENEDKKMISFLLEKGANVNLNNNGKLPLDYANNNEEIIALLKSHGAKTKEELDAEEKRIAEEKKLAEEKLLEEKRKKAEEYFIQACNFCNDGLNFKMIEYLEKAANLGHILAHHNLAICYMAGTYVEKDIDKAIELLTVPAEAGNVDSQLNLGVALFHKYPTNNLMDSIERDKASDWFKKAAEQGSVEAMYNLGLFYLSLEDFDDAGTWFEKAARLGHPQALEALKNLCSRGLYFVKM